MSKNLPQTYCINLFSQTATDNSGFLRPCCHHEDFDQESTHLSQCSFKDFLSSPEMREKQALALQGQKVPGCEHCYRLEESGVWSMRQRHNFQYASLIEELSQKNHSPELHFIDLRPGNLCNLGCIMCSPEASSRLNSEWKKHGEERFSNQFRTVSEANSHFPIETWYKSDLFVEEFIAQAKGLKKLWLLGGEPLIHPQCLEILQKLVFRGKDLELEISTNLTHLDDDLLSLLNHFNVSLKCSVDGFGQHARYIRYPCRFEEIEANLDRLFSSKIPKEIVFSVSILNLFHLKDFYFWLKEKCTQHQTPCSLYVTNVVTLPAHLSIANLPQDLKTQALTSLQQIIDDIDSGSSLIPVDSFHGLSNFLKNSEGDVELIRKGWKFIEHFDRVRGNSWKEIAPWVEEIL